MPEVKLGPWTVGIDHISPELNLSPRAARDAVNVDFDRDGNMHLRPKVREAMVAAGLHSLYSSKNLGVSLCMQDNILNRVEVSNIGFALSPIATLLTGAKVSYDELMGEIVFSNRSSAGITDGHKVRSLGVETPGAIRATSTQTGGMDQGKYAVAITFMRGDEESATSDYEFVSVPKGGGIHLDMPPPQSPAVTAIRVYVTEPNSELLYRHSDIAASATSADISLTSGLGRACDTDFCDQMIRGDIVRYWKGRLLMARDNILYFSEPLRYGLYRPGDGFVQEATRITLVQPVEGGIFVGTRSGIVFYAGETPAKWTRRLTGGKPPVEGTGITVPFSVFAGALAAGAGNAAMWLAENGFVVGNSDGSLVQPQSARIKLSSSGRGAMAVSDRRALVTIT